MKRPQAAAHRYKKARARPASACRKVMHVNGPTSCADSEFFLAGRAYGLASALIALRGLGASASAHQRTARHRPQGGTCVCQALAAFLQLPEGVLRVALRCRNCRLVLVDTRRRWL